MKKIYNLTIATDIQGKGGISSVLNVLDSECFFTDTKSKVLISHSTNGRFGFLSQLMTFLLCIFKLLLNFILFDIRLVHIHMASRGSYIRKSILIRLAKFFHVKVIIHLHGAEFRCFYNDESSNSKRNHIRNTFNMADKIIVLSNQWLFWLNTLLDDKTKGIVIYNAVPVLSLEPITRTDFFNFVFLGRLGKRKGVGDLILAFSKVIELYPNARLFLGGDGDIDKFNNMSNNLGLENKVIFLGWISGDAKLDILNKADSFVLPSYNEGFPMGILEAMSCNIPVIASNVGGIPDAITSGEEGLLIDAGDVNSLIKAMIFSIESPLEVKKMQAMASDKYMKNFSPGIIIPQIIEIYKELGAI
ncbi:glycosyltransferase family 4 protein [Shewanella frigidimarina]|uniref:glycosyltransferase family 4 protein n=1 Tax=Shewanella frigidimarina TaxID=56812 RepID=UPI003D792CFB